MRAGILTLLSAAVFLVFSGWAVGETASRVEADVRYRVERTLMAQKLGYADARIMGRDVYLTGSLANDVHYRSASVAVADVPGVRSIGRTETPGVPSLIRVTSADGRVTLRGDVANPEVRAAVVVAVGDVLGQRALIDSLKVTLERDEPLWKDDIREILQAVSDGLPEFDLYLGGTALYVEGKVAEELARTEVGEVLGQMLPGFVINNAIRIPGSGDEFGRHLAGFLRTDPLRFPTESSELTEELRRAMDRLVPLLLAYPNGRVRVESHVGASADAAKDLTLTYNRANVLREYLLERGVPPTRLESVGLGGSVPVADNSTPAGRLANSRIELHVIEES